MKSKLANKFSGVSTSTSRSPSKHRHIEHHPITDKTRDFIQKICYRQAASIDMTQHGFITDSKSHLICLMLKPLREKLEIICGKPHRVRLITFPKTSSSKHSNSSASNSKNKSYSPMQAKIRSSPKSPKRRQSTNDRPVPAIQDLSICKSPKSLQSTNDILDSAFQARAISSWIAEETSPEKRYKISFPTVPQNSKVIYESGTF